MQTKKMAGNLIFPTTKVLLTNVVEGNLASQIKVITAANNSMGNERVLNFPKEGIFISASDKYEIEVKTGSAGTKRKSILTIGNPDACTECSFEYGFGVKQLHFYKKQWEEPCKHITGGYYDRMSNPNAIDGTTGLFTATALATINERLIDAVNNHRAYHPDAGPVVKAGRVYKIARDANDDVFDVDITIGSTTVTIDNATHATFVTELLAETGTVMHAWIGETDLITYVALYDTVTIVAGAADNTVTRDNTRIGLEGLYVNPSYEVINAKGFELTVTHVVNGKKPYLDGANVFDMFFNRKHQGSLSHWTRLDQPLDELFNKRIIMVKHSTHAMHGASHEDGYTHVYEVFYPQSAETIVAALFEAAGGTTATKFPLSNL